MLANILIGLGVLMAIIVIFVLGIVFAFYVVEQALCGNSKKNKNNPYRNWW